MLITEIKRNEGENEQSFLWRVGRLKDSGMLEATWDEIATIMNREFRIDETEYRTEAAYRKQYASAKSFFINVFSKFENESENEQIRDIDEQIETLRKERVKLQDERVSYNRKIREQARLEQRLDRLEESLHEVGRTNFAVSPDITVSDNPSDKEMIVVLSDLHIGSEFYSVGGMFNADIALERISEYANKVKQIREQCGADVCHLVLLGDLIEGGVTRVTQRIESSDNMVEQTKTAAMLVSNFVTQMSMVFGEVHVYNVTGNHSRIEANKENSMRDERLDDLVFWCAEQMLAHLKNVQFMPPLDSTYDMFYINSQRIVITHGDFDDFTDAGMGKLCFMIGSVPDLVICGHKHYPELSEVNGIKVMRSGCLCGSGNDYTMKKRLTGKASQSVLVMDEDGIEAFYPVRLE